jgi:hypothetical protein
MQIVHHSLRFIYIFIVRVRACVRACVLAVRCQEEDLRMSVPFVVITLLPAEQEASKNVHKLAQEVYTERKVEFVCAALLQS